MLGCQQGLPALQEDDKHGDDGLGAEDQVTEFLEEELRRDPPRLDFEGFQGLVRSFSELAGVPTTEASTHTSCELAALQCQGRSFQ